MIGVWGIPRKRLSPMSRDRVEGHGNPARSGNETFSSERAVVQAPESVEAATRPVMLTWRGFCRRHEHALAIPPSAASSKSVRPARTCRPPGSSVTTKQDAAVEATVAQSKLGQPSEH